MGYTAKLVSGKILMHVREYEAVEMKWHLEYDFEGVFEEFTLLKVTEKVKDSDPYLSTYLNQYAREKEKIGRCCLLIINLDKTTNFEIISSEGFLFNNSEILLQASAVIDELYRLNRLGPF